MKLYDPNIIKMTDAGPVEGIQGVKITPQQLSRSAPVTLA